MLNIPFLNLRQRKELDEERSILTSLDMNQTVFLISGISHSFFMIRVCSYRNEYVNCISLSPIFWFLTTALI